MSDLNCHSSSTALEPRAVIELTRLKCKKKGNKKGKITDEAILEKTGIKHCRFDTS